MTGSDTPHPTVGVLIRFANSARTLPGVLAALGRQTRRPDAILGVANHSTDGSKDLMTAAGTRMVDWNQPYDHSRVLNFGLSHLETDLVLVLSSHTVLESTDAIERMARCFDDPAVACASAMWDEDPYYSSEVTWSELRAKGLRFGSIYSNSMGMVRRAWWQEQPFDESLPIAEDYAWAIGQLAKGRRCRRLDLPFSYQRGGRARHGEFARVVFRLAKAHGLKVTWLGVGASLNKLMAATMGRTDGDIPAIKERLAAWATTRL